MIRTKSDGAKKQSRRIPSALKITALILILLVAFYCTFTFSNIPVIAKARHILIETAMSTMRHQWIATALFPQSVVDEVMDKVKAAQMEQVGVESTWEIDPSGSGDNPNISVEDPTPQELAFFTLFHELEPAQVRAYVKEHPEAIRDGWEKLYINEAGLDDDGTGMKTRQGDEVLAIDAVNQILLVEVTGTGYRGVMAIAKDPSRLSVSMAETLGKSGQHLGTICKNNGAVLGLTANGFEDYNEKGESGKGNGGILSGYTMSNGVPYGSHLKLGWKRIELRSDDRLYIVDTIRDVHEDCTDAAEFTPALIVDGKILVDEYCGWNAINPRTCIGQTRRDEILLLCIEGRLITSLGVGVVRCAEIMYSYDCVQAMNLDGGTSSIMWFQGEYVTRCSNTALPYGRPLPNAFTYAGTAR